MLKPLDRNKVHAFYSSKSKYRGYVNRGVACTHRFWVHRAITFSLLNNSSNQKSHNVDDEGSAFFDSMMNRIKKMQTLAAPKIDEFKLLRDSQNHDTSTGTRHIDELYSDLTAPSWYDFLGFESQFICNYKKLTGHP